MFPGRGDQVCDAEPREVRRLRPPQIHSSLRGADWPGRCLGIENRKGTLRPGADADLVVLDCEGVVLSTWVKGREVWTRTEH